MLEITITCYPKVTKLTQQSEIKLTYSPYSVFEPVKIRLIIELNVRCKQNVACLSINGYSKT
jgi:hypothetical protein